MIINEYCSLSTVHCICYALFTTAATCWLSVWCFLSGWYFFFTANETKKMINIKRKNNEWLLELHVMSVSGSSAASLCFLCMSFKYAIRYSSSSSDNGWYCVAPVAFTWYEYKGMTVDDTATKSVGKLYKNIALVDATLYFVVVFYAYVLRMHGVCCTVRTVSIGFEHWNGLD